MPNALIAGCAGPVLSTEERNFFARSDPLGLILFARNCDTPDQIRCLVTDFRQAVGRQDAPVLIDQEGGRVQRLKPPQWRAAPPAAVFGDLYERDAGAAREAARLNARLIGAELADLGITVDCLPCLDVRHEGGHDVIGDRSFSKDPQVVAALGLATCEGLLTAGVLPVVKHIPGHGRAGVDSHLELPVVETDHGSLLRIDFEPFRALAQMPLAMTAHVIYTALDKDAPATLSKTVLHDTIRSEIGFDGLIMSDDISMQALSGSIAERAQGALAAGCDVVLHCNGKMDEMIEASEVIGTMSAEAKRRWAAAQKSVPAKKTPIGGLNEVQHRLDTLLGATP